MTNPSNWTSSTSTYPGSSSNNTATIATTGGAAEVYVSSALAQPLSWVQDDVLPFRMTSGGAMTISNATGSACAGNYNSCFAAGVTVAGGAFTLNSGSTSGSYNGKTSFSSLIQSSGTLAGTGIIDISGLTALTGGTMSGSGTTNANGGMTVATGTATLNRTVNTTTLGLSSGTLAGSGALTATGLTTLSGGTINHTGGVINANGGLSITGPVILTTGVTVKGDYNNTAFGTGNSFAKRGQVTGAGAINAYGTISRSVTGGTGVTVGGTGGGSGTTPTLTMALGNVHVGDAKSFSYQIANGSSDAILRGAIQTTTNSGNITDSRLSGTGVTAGNFGPIATGSNSGNLAVTVTPNAGGAITLSGQKVNLIYNYDNVSSQLVTLATTGAAYRYAAANTIAPVTLTNVHVNGTFGTSALSISNTATNDAYSEKLDAGFGALGGLATTNGGSFGLLAAGSSNTSLIVGLGGNAYTGFAGTKSGTALVNLTSNGAGTSGLANTSLTAQTVNISGGVYRYAAPNTITTPVNLGIIHVGDSFGTSAVSMTNTATNDGYSEKLNASIGSVSGSASGSGSINQLAAGSSSSALSVGLANANTAVAGAQAGTVAVNLVSDGTGSSGLGTANLAGQNVTVNGQVNNYAQAAFTSTGSGLFSGSGASYTLNLGPILQGTGVALGSLNLANIGGSGAFTDLMDGTFNATGVNNFTLTGFNTFTNLAGGSSLSSLMISLNNGTAGTFAEDVTLSWSGHNADYTEGANNITLHLTGTVSSVPVPTAAWLLGSGLLGLVGVARRKTA